MKNTKQRTTFLGSRTAVPVRTFKGAVALITAALLALLITACPNSAGGGSTPQSKYTVNFNVEGANGTLTAKVDGAAINSGAQVQKGKTVLFTATPKAGYRVKGWTLDGTAVNGKNNTYSLNITKAAAVKVSFESNAVPLPKYAVTFGVDGANGALTAKADGIAETATSPINVEKGKTVLFTATPKAGYRVKGWTLDGAAVNGKNGTYPLTVSKVAAVKVSFESNAVPLPKYAVTFGVDGANGTLTALGPNFQPITTGAEIEKGKKVRFTAVPAPGYMTGSWTISGGSFEAGTGTPENPLANVTVSAPLTVKVSFKPADSIPLSKLDIEGTVLKGYTGEKPAGKLRVPAHITEIAEYAFKDCTGITEVHLPENLTKIGKYAFKDCEGITKLSLSKNLTHIAYGAFSGCRNLEGMLEFPENLTLIDKGAFKDCNKLTALDFSKCTQPLTIGNYAFEGCKITGTVKLPACLSSLGQSAFWNCNMVALFDFYACSNPPLTAIGTDAFNYTTGRFKVKTGTGIKTLLTASGVAAGKIDEAP